MTSLSPFLRNSLKVTPTDSDNVEVTVTLPANVFVHYIQLLESLSGFFQFTQRQAKLAQIKAHAVSEQYAKECEQRISEYRSLLVSLYDQYITSGLDRKSAIKQVAADLRSDKHPWCCPDLVRSSLIAAGRRGTSGRPRSQL